MDSRGCHAVLPIPKVIDVTFMANRAEVGHGSFGRDRGFVLYGVGGSIPI